MPPATVVLRRLCLSFIAVLAVPLAACSGDGENILSQPGTPTAASPPVASATPLTTATSAPTATTVPPPTATPVPTATQPASLSEQAILNAEYPIELLPQGRIKLTNGSFVGPYIGFYKPDVPPPTLTVTLLEQRARGRIDDDPLEDAAVVLSAKTDGTTGTFYYLAAVLNQAGQPHVPSTTGLGDRVILREIRVVNQTIEVALTVQGPQDGACCPTKTVVRSFALRGSSLEQVAETP